MAVVRGSCHMKSWAEVWPQAKIWATESGSVTTDIFAQMVGVFGQYLQQDSVDHGRQSFFA